jgi:hypothetical protein
MAETITCHECSRPARAAIRTTRPSRAGLRVTLYPDDRSAPGPATRYCHEHAVQLMHDLTATLVDGDE